ncbi:trimethylamine methyltransferase family protein [Shimia sp. CNT1-13L.2]|uniref:trimethylamine methyltransferase family protein n=1 Tax=Shimia sp. CNT1-13L.2 TaxID=2959663 RepID=UPI0020CF4CD9|nr:trimethylamine methyltransferase family protein [Shimia sp. CNT1-13L.2]MCP9481143.1 trimethylamine methyltransferase family protein [Shimia sp. CNT1-13L.2]
MARRGQRRQAKSIQPQAAHFGPVQSHIAPVEILSADQVEAIHHASLRVLQETGIEIMSPAARTLFRNAGAEVDDISERVRLAPELIETTIATCPAQWTLHARNPSRNVPIGGNWLAYCNATTPPYVSGPNLPRQPGSLKTFTEAIRLCQSLDQMHFFYGYPVEPQDLPVPTRHLDAYHALATQTDKVWRAYAMSDMTDALEVARIARGISHDQFAQEPSLLLNCNTNSPLKIDGPMCDGLIAMSSRGQPVVISAFTMAGAMAPITMAGALVEQNAECLAGMTLTQLVKPGAPVIYGAFTSNVHMRSGSVALGTPEYAQAAIAGGQLARRYGVPYKSSNVNSANAPDAQSAYESMNTLWATHMGHCNVMAHGIGWLESGLTFSFEKAIIDAEMLRMMQAFHTPMDLGPEALGVEAIARVGPGGHFFADQMTLDRYETAFWEPMLSDWRPFDAWVEAGSKTATERAGDIARHLLDTYQTPPIDPAIREELDSYLAKRKEDLS